MAAGEGQRRRTAAEDNDISRLNNLPECILLHILSFLADDAQSCVRTSALSKRWTNLWKNVVVLDRFSQLPDSILHHILSFLDDITPWVRTCLLSRRWKNLWKRIPNALHNLRATTFDTEANTHKFLSNLRPDCTSVKKIGFTFVVDGLNNHIEMFDMVMEHAASLERMGHDRLEVLSISSDVYYPFDRLASSITRNCLHESLTTLKLDRIKFGPSCGSIASLGSNRLTTLELRRCSLEGLSGRDHHDPFAGFPCLKGLKLVDCFYWNPVRVSGPELLSLEIRTVSRTGRPQICGLFAPKLESLYLSAHVYDIWRLDEASLPSVARADVRVEWTSLECFLGSEGAIEKANLAFMTLLRGLCSAESLDLNCLETKECWNQRLHSPLGQVKPLIEDELSRFTRLKTSTIRIQ